jgi:hypothetical protein
MRNNEYIESIREDFDRLSVVDSNQTTYDKLGWAEGGSVLCLNREHYTALLSGKTIDYCDGEYVTRIVLDKSLLK